MQTTYAFTIYCTTDGVLLYYFLICRVHDNIQTLSSIASPLITLFHNKCLNLIFLTKFCDKLSLIVLQFVKTYLMSDKTWHLSFRCFTQLVVHLSPI